MKILRAVEVLFLAALIFVAIEAGLTLHRVQGALPEWWLTSTTWPRITSAWRRTWWA